MASDQTNSPPPFPSGSSARPRTPATLAWETMLDLSGADGPLHRRLTDTLRDAVRDGRLPSGAALPPSRELATSLGVSRWTVTQAYGELVAEGMLDARTGSGTRVAASDSRAGALPASATVAEPWTPAPRRRHDLAAGVPDLRHVPRAAWGRAVRDALADAPDVVLGAGDPSGLPALREVLAAYLSRARVVRAQAHDVVVTHGAADGLARLARALRAAGHTAVAVEDPGWVRLHDVLRAAGLEPVPVPVDEDGLDVGHLATLTGTAGVRAVLLTPAHQFPTGVALGPARREQVAGWARDVGGLVVEDDYDAEFRYDRRAVAALQGLAPDRVALLGSVSKTLSPAFGLGWLVLPPVWRDALREAGEASPPPSPSTLDQLAFARLVASGSYERHLRAARGRFRRRRGALLDALAAHLPDLPVTGLAAGMHVLLGLPDRVDAADVAQEAALHDVTVAPLSRYRASGTPEAGWTAAPRDALVVGYGNLADARVDDAVARLAASISTPPRRSR